jgi:hypothetical protein
VLHRVWDDPDGGRQFKKKRSPGGYIDTLRFSPIAGRVPVAAAASIFT